MRGRSLSFLFEDYVSARVGLEHDCQIFYMKLCYDWWTVFCNQFGQSLLMLRAYHRRQANVVRIGVNYEDVSLHKEMKGSVACLKHE